MDGIFIGIGSNLGDRPGHLRAACAGLERAGLEIIRRSSVWETEPVDSPEPLWFLNMVVEVRAPGWTAERLLAALLEVERASGRLRSVPNAPRTLDLDLLLMGAEQVRSPQLEIPHPRMWQRAFVLEPLAEIAPELRNPATGRTVENECEALGNRPALNRIGELESIGELRSGTVRGLDADSVWK